MTRIADLIASRSTKELTETVGDIQPVLSWLDSQSPRASEEIRSVITELTANAESLRADVDRLKEGMRLNDADVSSGFREIYALRKQLTTTLATVEELKKELAVFQIGTPEYYDSRIDCAAIRMPDGRVWTGKRHHHCIQTITQASDVKATRGVQGFVTMGKRFVTREEAAALVKKTGQVPRFENTELFSEDLY